MNDQPAIITIAKKEIVDNTRNINIIIVTAVFAIITVLVSFIGTLTSGGSWNDMNATVQMMMFFIQFIVPIIGLMLGYSSIIGEIERGTMSALLAEPATRLEIIIGKFLGLSLVIAISIFIGLISAGVIISLNVSEFDFGLYMAIILYTILFGMIFISISMFFSSILKRRTQAIGMSIFTWSFFSFLWGILILMWFQLSIHMDWDEADSYFAINIFSPVQEYLCLISVNVGGDRGMPSLGMSTMAQYFPDFYTAGVLLILMALWIIVPLILSYIAFNKRDV